MKTVYILLGTSGAGKTEAQKFLQRLGYKPYHMIGFLYRQIANTLGYPYNQMPDLKLWDAQFKDVEIVPGLRVIDYLVNSFHFHQNQGFPIATMNAKVEIPALLENGYNMGLCITSVRHVSELQAILDICKTSDAKAVPIFLTRGSATPRSTDENLEAVANLVKDDLLYLTNNGSLEELKEKLNDVIIEQESA